MPVFEWESVRTVYAPSNEAKRNKKKNGKAVVFLLPFLFFLRYFCSIFVSSYVFNESYLYTKTEDMIEWPNMSRKLYNWEQKAAFMHLFHHRIQIYTFLQCIHALHVWILPRPFLQWDLMHCFLFLDYKMSLYIHLILTFHRFAHRTCFLVKYFLFFCFIIIPSLLFNSFCCTCLCDDNYWKFWKFCIKWHPFS